VGRSSNPVKGRIFLLSTSYRAVLRPIQPPMQLAPVDGSPGVKTPKLETDNSGPSSAESKNEYRFTTTDRLCGLVVRVLGYRSGGPGSIPGTTRKKK
jgi:hypothetical protein